MVSWLVQPDHPPKEGKRHTSHLLDCVVSMREYSRIGLWLVPFRYSHCNRTHVQCRCAVYDCVLRRIDCCRIARCGRDRVEIRALQCVSECAAQCGLDICAYGRLSDCVVQSGSSRPACSDIARRATTLGPCVGDFKQQRKARGACRCVRHSAL